MIEIKSFKSSDFSKLVDVWQQAVEATHFFLTKEDIIVYKEVVEGYLPTLEIYIIEINQNTAGFIGLAAAHVEMLFIHPQHHGIGLGKKLLNYAVQFKGKLSVDVNEQNPTAYRFYIKYGFLETGRSEIDGAGKPYPLIHMMQQ